MEVGGSTYSLADPFQATAMSPTLSRDLLNSPSSAWGVSDQSGTALEAASFLEIILSIYSVSIVAAR